MYEYEIQNKKTKETILVFYHFDFQLWADYDNNEWDALQKTYID